jgi:hypothetical protein
MNGKCFHDEQSKKRRRPLRRTTARNACKPWCHLDFFNPARSGDWVLLNDRHRGKITPQLHQPLDWQRRVPPQVGQSLAVDELEVLASVEQSPTLPESACQ